LRAGRDRLEKLEVVRDGRQRRLPGGRGQSAICKAQKQEVELLGFGRKRTRCRLRRVRGRSVGCEEEEEELWAAKRKRKRTMFKLSRGRGMGLQEKKGHLFTGRKSSQWIDPHYGRCCSKMRRGRD
jgi:hypothetical protein